MANNRLFSTRSSGRSNRSMTRNKAGGRAYVLAPKHALAQYAATGCFNSTTYTSAQDQLEAAAALARSLDARYVAQLAIWSREHAVMKDMPALLLAILSLRDPRIFESIFFRIIDSTRMMSSFVRIMRSGVAGRKSLGTRPRRLIRQWLERLSDDQLFCASVGTDPSLADIIRLAHPRSTTPSRSALYAYLLGREHDSRELPKLVRDFQAFESSVRLSKGTFK